MTEKHIFDGNNWIVTSGEIKITPLDGTRPMHPALSKKLYNQNIIKHCKMKLGRPWCEWTLPIFPNRITATTTTIDKYTIVELTHNNKHYHGLASRADCDKDNADTGIAVAYHRAFGKMMQRPQTNKTAVDGAIDFFIKLRESKAHFRKCLLGAYGVTDEEVGLKENMHKHNLKSHLKSIAKERSEFP